MQSYVDSYDIAGRSNHYMGDHDTPFQYVGAYGIQTDPNGLINMRARYYDPYTQRFISADPSGFDGGLNWYMYANGNPLNYIDLDGCAPTLQQQIYDDARRGTNTTLKNVSRMVAEQTRGVDTALNTIGVGVGVAMTGAIGYTAYEVGAFASAAAWGTSAYSTGSAVGSKIVTSATVTAKLTILKHAPATMGLFLKTAAYTPIGSFSLGTFTGALGVDDGAWLASLANLELGPLDTVINLYGAGNTAGSLFSSALNTTYNQFFPTNNSSKSTSSFQNASLFQSASAIGIGGKYNFK